MTDAQNDLSLVFSEADTLLPVPDNELRSAWQAIRPAIERIAAKCDEPWIAEDVFLELVNRQSFLWATGDRTGFAVLRVYASAYCRELFIWIAHIGDRPEGCAHYMPQFMEIARDNGCERVSWESPRPFHKLFKTAKRRWAYSLDVGS